MKLSIARRTAIICIIREESDSEFRSELSYYLNGIDDRDYPYDEINAIFDIERNCEEGNYEHSKRLLKIVRRILIATGFYRVMSKDETDNTWSSNGHIWNFKLDKIPYTTDYNIAEWCGYND